MKRNLLLFGVAFLALSVSAQSAPAGAVNGLFSVAENKQVFFSQGNLQYQASTDTWRFAENQYDTIGMANANVADAYDGWIDLFGWGTGDNPTKMSEEDDYSSFTEWGNNPVSNGGNTSGLWRSMSKDEFVYLFHERANAENLFGLGSVNGVYGLIVLPDAWVLPEGSSFVPSTTKGLVWDEKTKYYYNEGHSNYEHNTYTVKQWSLLQSNGAVFLPAAGIRWDTDQYDTQNAGYYWASTKVNSMFCYYVYFDWDNFYPQAFEDPFKAFSVRLVQEFVPSSVSAATEDIPALKVVRNGQVLVLRNGKTYSVTGVEL